MFGEKSLLRLFHIQVFCPLVSIYRTFLLCTTSLILLICLKSSSFCRTVQNICTSFKAALVLQDRKVYCQAVVLRKD